MSPLETVAAAVTGSSRLALACHIGPDGDALGSMLGMGLAARGAGKEVVASFGSPFVVPSNLGFLPGQELLVSPTEFPDDPETVMVFDVGSADRIGELADKAARASTVIVIDHHVTNDGFGDLQLIDHGAAATGVLVKMLLDQLGWPITAEVATCLHTAVVTDTGRFSYSNTRPETLRVAADLLEAGASPTEVARHVYEEAPFGFLTAAGVALSRARLDEELGVVTTFITQRELATAGIDWGDIDGLIDTLRLAREADVAIVAKVHDDGRVKLSMRSRGATDVGSLAMAHGGGGHRLAAGFTENGEPEEVLARITAELPAYR